MMFAVTARATTAREPGAVVVRPPKGAAVSLTADEARELQRAILAAVVFVERGQRAVVAKAKTATARQIRRAAQVDETLRDREGGR
ncbi:hypothetical protein [Microbacterium enclense]|uniref:hypothetical protein n=1 Tax=Microbacterium enclense TaxID=993073 RepID=UPI003F82372D